MKEYEMVRALGEVEKCIHNSGQITGKEDHLKDMAMDRRII
jgi:hypothetical protein